VALAVVAWCAVLPTVLLLNLVVNATAQALGLPPETHALTKLGGRPVRDQVLLAAEACAGAPLREELLVRGLLLWWCVGRVKARGAGVAPITSIRPWLVMLFAGLLAAVGGRWQPVAFAGVLVVGFAALWRFKRTGARRARAVYATAALFALLHPVWPNPVPLFVLGLGLGWLAARTTGLLVPVLVHALFNAVSAVFVLRGG
jgi:membrane protease YdiL (CAAX protease family)